MKTKGLVFSSLTLFLTFFLLLQYGCSKDETDNSVPVPTNKIVVDIDGSPWSAVEVSWIYSTDHSRIWFSGLNANGDNVSLLMPDSAQPGTYELTYLGSYKVYYEPKDSVEYTATSGSLIISDHDISKKIIEGTFFGEGYNNNDGNYLPFTNGSFYIDYD